MVAKAKEINRVAEILERTRKLSGDLTVEEMLFLEIEFQCTAAYDLMKGILTIVKDHMFTENEWALIDDILGDNIVDFNRNALYKRTALVCLTKIAVERA